MQKSHLIVVILSAQGPSPLSPVFPLLDVHEHLASLFLARTCIHVLPTEPADHALEDVAHFCFEVVLVVVRPAEEGGNEVLEVRTQKVGRHGVYCELYETKYGLDDLTVRGRDEDEECGEDFALHLSRECVWAVVRRTAEYSMTYQTNP